MTATFCLQLILATVPDNENSTSPRIVSENNIKFLFDIQKKVDAIRANYSGSMVSLQDICMKPLDKDCDSNSPVDTGPIVGLRDDNIEDIMERPKRGTKLPSYLKDYVTN
ncbi:hypothetical protein V8G54_027204 [Vigna mungo]|uniref:NPC1 middle luminal domain-containing protein n=1 Tax=Vigna mungo TaxID=3915 RepID=A0AAQ3N206_VIGMU